MILHCSQRISPPERLQSSLRYVGCSETFASLFLVVFLTKRWQRWRTVYPRFPNQLSCEWDSFLVRLQGAQRAQSYIGTLNAALQNLLHSILRRLLYYCVPARHHPVGLSIYVVLTFLWVSELKATMCMTKRTTICTNTKFVKPQLNHSVSGNWNESQTDSQAGNLLCTFWPYL